MTDVCRVRRHLVILLYSLRYGNHAVLPKVTQRWLWNTTSLALAGSTIRSNPELAVQTDPLAVEGRNELASVDLPVALTVISDLQQPVLGIMPLAAVGTD